MTVTVTKASPPKVKWLSGGGNWYGGTAGVVVINFNPEGPDGEEYIRSLPDGTLLISLGIIDSETCLFNCDVRLYIKGCSTCDTPTLLRVTTTTVV